MGRSSLDLPIPVEEDGSNDHDFASHDPHHPSSPIAQRRPPAPNFSRPRPVSSHEHQKLKHDRTDSAVYSIRSFCERSNVRLDAEQEQLPVDSETNGSGGDAATPPVSAASEFAWDDIMGELRSRRRDVGYDSQRAPRIPQRTASSSNNNNKIRPPHPAAPVELPADTTTTVRTSRTAAPAAAAPSPSVPTKRADRLLPRPRAYADHQSKRSSGLASDAASHHTRSSSTATDSTVGGSSSGGGGYRVGGVERWKSSDYDTAGLSAAQMQKLRKKGIDPALYAEMKAARKGRSRWVASLTGNSFIG